MSRLQKIGKEVFASVRSGVVAGMTFIGIVNILSPKLMQNWGFSHLQFSKQNSVGSLINIGKEVLLWGAIGAVWGAIKGIFSKEKEAPLPLQQAAIPPQQAEAPLYSPQIVQEKQHTTGKEPSLSHREAESTRLKEGAAAQR